MSPDARGRIAEAATCPPVLLNAADFGHVHRSRLYWGISSEHLVRRGRDAAIDVHVAGQLVPDVHVVRWSGSARPLQWQPQPPFARIHSGGYRAPPLPGTDLHIEYPAGRFLTFTTVFPHPSDRPGAADEAAKHRFQADGR
eukprot:2412228-Amphidinium_carterae.1